MNDRARRLGLNDTHYANPVGLDDPGNYSSAADLSRLARRLLRNDVFATIVDCRRARLTTRRPREIVTNRNDLVARVPWIDGVKTGHTVKAGYVLVGSGTRKGVRLVSVVLGEPSQARRDDRHAGAARLRLLALPAAATLFARASRSQPPGSPTTAGARRS